MRKFAIFGGLIICGLVLLQWSFLEPRAQTDPQNCTGTKFTGAWFNIQIPEGMTATQSLASSTGDGADSIWVRSETGETEFYAYAPQWGGTPYDIFLGATDRREVSRKETVQQNHTDLELRYEKNIGRFDMVQSNNPISHLTTGYRNKTGELSPNELLQYACFKGSINQFSD
jgi:hypothetical protein